MFLTNWCIFDALTSLEESFFLLHMSVTFLELTREKRWILFVSLAGPYWICISTCFKRFLFNSCGTIYYTLSHFFTGTEANFKISVSGPNCFISTQPDCYHTWFNVVYMLMWLSPFVPRYLSCIYCIKFTTVWLLNGQIGLDFNQTTNKCTQILIKRWHPLDSLMFTCSSRRSQEPS